MLLGTTTMESYADCTKNEVMKLLGNKYTEYQIDSICNNTIKKNQQLNLNNIIKLRDLLRNLSNDKFSVRELKIFIRVFKQPSGENRNYYYSNYTPVIKSLERYNLIKTKNVKKGQLNIIHTDLGKKINRLIISVFNDIKSAHSSILNKFSGEEIATIFSYSGHFYSQSKRVKFGDRCVKYGYCTLKREKDGYYTYTYNIRKSANLYGFIHHILQLKET